MIVFIFIMVIFICIANETVINKGEVDGYKGCIKTHLEPCIVRIELGHLQDHIYSYSKISKAKMKC